MKINITISTLSETNSKFLLTAEGYIGLVEMSFLRNALYLLNEWVYLPNNIQVNAILTSEPNSISLRSDQILDDDEIGFGLKDVPKRKLTLNEFFAVLTFFSVHPAIIKDSPYHFVVYKEESLALLKANVSKDKIAQIFSLNGLDFNPFKDSLT